MDSRNLRNGSDASQLVIYRKISEQFKLTQKGGLDNEHKQKICHSVNALIARLSFSEKTQVSDIEFALSQQVFNENLSLIIVKNKKIVAQLILYAKYILDGSSSYTRLFRDKFLEFEKNIDFEPKNIFWEELTKLAISQQHFLSIILLAYTEVAAQELILGGFLASELMGHDLAYTIAQNPGRYKRLIIKNETEQILESFAIHELIILRDKLDSKSHDNGLVGSVLIPEYVPENIPEQPIFYINWAGTHSKKTMLADLELAAGEESYRRGEDQILMQIINLLFDFYKFCQRPIKINFSGHSLGGALAQLNFHSFQRLIATNHDDQQQVVNLESKFIDALHQSGIAVHQRVIHDLQISPGIISTMNLDVWNSAGVIDAVEKHSNELCRMLVDMSIKQTANYGFVAGDIVQVTGQGNILSDVEQNGAIVTILKIEPDTARKWTTLLGPFSGLITGGLIGPAFLGMGTAGGGLLFGLIVLLAASKSKVEAHTMKHFQHALLPNLTYNIYCSHLVDGNLNTDVKTGYTKIKLELSNKSNFILNFGSRLISAYGPASHLRLLSEKESYQRQFLKSLEVAEQEHKCNPQGFFLHASLLKELNSNKNGAEERILNVLIQKNYYNEVGKAGQTFLHIAIELNKFSLASRLLEIDNIDYDRQDENGNTPILLLINKMRITYYQTQECYALGIKLLNKKPNLELANKQEQTVAKMYASWSWHGIYARNFATILKEQLTLPTKIFSCS